MDRKIDELILLALDRISEGRHKITQPGKADLADVTVVIPAYRAEYTIDRALASVAAQTLKPAAVVVVDDGSDDATFDTARSWSDRLGDVALKVIQQQNAGAGAARNRALMEAETTFVAFLDADDEWLPEKLASSMARIEGTDKVLVAHNSVSVQNGREAPIDCAERFRDSPHPPFITLYRKGPIDTATVVARRDAVLAAGGFDTGLANAQDFDLWLAMLKDRNANFEVFGARLTRYHVMPNSIMSHIERRRRCCMEIAGRYVFDLKAHGGSPVMDLWFRVIAVHYEAVMAGAARQDWGVVARTVLVLPFSLLSSTADYFLGRRRSRHPGLNTG